MIKNFIFGCLLLISHAFAVETLILIGSPGSGKGTFAEIAKENGYAHISAGDLIRDEIRQKTDLGLSIEQTVKEGKYIDPEIMFQLLKAKVVHYTSLNMPLIVDGYGRTKEDAKLLKDLLKDLDAETHVLLLEATGSICAERMMHRLVCQECDFVYSDLFGIEENANCPKCHDGKMQKRINDEKAIIEKRISQYHESVKPNYVEFLKEYPSDIRNTETDIDSLLDQHRQLIAIWKTKYQ